MTNLVNYLNFDVLKQYLFPLLVTKSQNNYKIANSFIWNLQIQHQDEDMEKFYGLLDTPLRKELKNTFILMNNLDIDRAIWSILHSVERNKMINRLYEDSIEDALTGLYNRRGFLALAKDAIALMDNLNYHSNLLKFYILD